MHLNISDSWKNILQTEFEKSYFKDLTEFVNIQNTTAHTDVTPKKKTFLQLLMPVLLMI